MSVNPYEGSELIPADFNADYQNIDLSDRSDEANASIVIDIVLFDYNNAGVGATKTGLSYLKIIQDQTAQNPLSFIPITDPNVIPLLYLSSVTKADIALYVLNLKSRDTNNTGKDDKVTAAELINFVNAQRKYYIQQLSNDNIGILTVDALKGKFNGGLEPTEKTDVRKAVTAFDKLDDPDDTKVTARDLRAFARSYNLNDTQKEALEDLYNLGNVFGVTDI